MQVPRHVKIHITGAGSEVRLPKLANAAQILVLQAQQIQMQESLFCSARTHSPSSAKIYSLQSNHIVINLFNFLLLAKIKQKTEITCR